MYDITTVLDIGNGYIKGLVIHKEGNAVSVLAKDMKKAKGIRKGVILDTNDFSYVVSGILENFRRTLSDEVTERVLIGVSHPSAKIYRSNERKRILTPKITHDNVSDMLKVISDNTSGDTLNDELIKVVPVYWTIDETLRVKDPVGMAGTKLTLLADSFFLPKNFVTSIEEVFHELDVEIEDIVPNVLGGTEAVLDIDAKDLGTVYIDIGANQTTYGIYEEGYALGYGTIPHGAEDVTKDVSIGMQIDIQGAETMKKTFGSVDMLEPQRNDEIDVLFLQEIVRARYEEILTMINERLAEMGKEGKLAGGIMLTGGGAMMDGITSLAKDVFGLAAFVATENHLRLEGVSDNQQFINALGVYQREHKYGEDHTQRFSFSFGKMGGIRKSIKQIFANLF